MILKNFSLLKNNLFIGFIALAILAVGCNKDAETVTPVIPAIETIPVIANLTAVTAQSGGIISNLGTGLTITATGVCWSSTNQTPTTADSKTSDGTNAGFKSILTGLTANTRYYLRAYVQNEAGTGYGNVVTFITSSTTADTTVTVSTFAGNNNGGFVNGTGTSASFNSPQGVAADAAGNLYVSDSFNHVIRKITAAGVVSTYAGNGELGFSGGNNSTAKFYSPQGIAVDAAGNVYVADQGNNAIYKITPTTTTILAGSGSSGAVNGTGTAASFSAPQGIAVDAASNVYVADRNNNLIRKITAAGVVTTFAGNGAANYLNAEGTAAAFRRPVAVAVDATGTLYVADQGNFAIRKITSAGVVSTLLGNSIISALLNTPAGIAVDAQGNLFITDQSGRILTITSTNILYRLAGKADTSGFLDGSKSTALFSGPVGIAINAAKNIFVADYNNNRIRKLMVN
ncbi:NHL repeat-containing protein [Mucilaginibacter terrae]|uniref:NHL repeat-containing protein n=1 Tax=Mucilaginibacter terrae TaxID=1955052 RepID=UPI0036457664